VKCDEGKPYCLKCHVFGVKCDGYAEFRPSKRTQKPIEPKINCPHPKSILPVTALFHGEDEYQYFIHFREDVTVTLAGPFTTEFWKSVVLRTCNDEVAIRQLSISIAALTMAKESIDPDGTHHQFAMRQYGKALNRIQYVVANHNVREALRISLIACALIFCFESLQGETERAIAQAKTALSLMRKKLFASYRYYSKVRLSSSVPGIETELLEMFVKLDGTIVSRMDNPNTPRQSQLEIDYEDHECTMPKAFHNVMEAKVYLEQFQYKYIPYLCRLTDVLLYGDRFACSVPEKDYEDIRKQLRHWYKAFAPLLAWAVTAEGSHDFTATAIVRVLALATDITAQRVCLGSGIKPLSFFEDESREVVDLSRRIVMDPMFKKKFIFDCGLIPPLFVVTMICRERSIREDAIQVLRMMEGRIEICWKAADIADLGERTLQAEDASLCEFKELCV